MTKKRKAAIAASKMIKDGMVLGLGTGSTAAYLVDEVGKLVAGGLNLKAVCTSKATDKQARSLNIPIIDINEVDIIDLAIDGVDEIDEDFNAIKGGGGALFREKVVASLASRVFWIMDDSKLVNKIGAFPLPVEIVAYGYPHVVKRLKDFNPVLRKQGGKPFITDNGNLILDLHLNPGFNINKVEVVLKNTLGVVETGLFLNFCNWIFVGTDEGVKEIINKSKRIKDDFN